MRSDIHGDQIRKRYHSGADTAPGARRRSDALEVCEAAAGVLREAVNDDRADDRRHVHVVPEPQRTTFEHPAADRPSKLWRLGEARGVVQDDAGRRCVDNTTANGPRGPVVPGIAISPGLAIAGRVKVRIGIIQGGACGGWAGIGGLADADNGREEEGEAEPQRVSTNPF